MSGEARIACEQKTPTPTGTARSRGRTSVGPPALAAGSLLLGGLLLALRMAQDTVGLPFQLPGFWYGNRTLWYAVGLAFVGGGIAMLRELPREAVRWRPSRPGIRFRHLVLYSKSDCPLCEEAIEVLTDYRWWMPPPEVLEIDGDAELKERFADCVPVILIEGRIRFRGRINEVLLRRLIEATPPLDTTSPSTSV